MDRNDDTDEGSRGRVHAVAFGDGEGRPRFWAGHLLSFPAYYALSWKGSILTYLTSLERVPPLVRDHQLEKRAEAPFHERDR